MAAEGTWVAGEVAKHPGTCRIVMAHKGRHVVTDTAHGDNINQESAWSQIIGKTAISLVGHNAGRRLGGGQSCTAPSGVAVLLHLLGATDSAA